MPQKAEGEERSWQEDDTSLKTEKDAAKIINVVVEIWKELPLMASIFSKRDGSHYLRVEMEVGSRGRGLKKVEKV